MMKIQAPLGAEPLRILRQIPGVTVVPQQRAGDRRPDAILHFAGRRARIAVEFKRRANAATAWQLVAYAATRPRTRLVLIADQTTTEAREILSGHGIGVIDGLGNAHVELPGLMLHREGRRRARADHPPTRLRGKAGVAAQALILRRERAWKVNDLAGEAGVSAGLAHRVLARLEKEGVVATEGMGPGRVRRVANPAALLDLWAEENDDRPTRTLGYLLAQTPRQLIDALGANLERSGIDHALTGAAAASVLAPFVTAVPVVEAWVAAAAGPEELYDGARVDRVPDGHNVVFLQAKDDTPLAFRERAKRLWIVNRFRLYADLRGDPRRGREQAEHFRREVIGF
ncbi:MAG: hypothetical protein HY775_04435 [Acidobacteria bacterium]|nr:hypothetical protein [Acidobacteriota bacterium]